MQLHVKQTFFLNKEEARKIGDPYIVTDMPHYKLEDGTLVYAKNAWGGDDIGLNPWYEVARTPEDYKSRGYGCQIEVVE